MIEQKDKEMLESMGYTQCKPFEKYIKHVKNIDGDAFTLQIWAVDPVKQNVVHGKYAAKAKYRYNSHFGSWLDDFYGDDFVELDKKMMEDIDKYQDW
jgi:hypothetical protein